MIHTFLEILPAYSLKSPNLFNFREGHQKGRGRQQGGAFFGRGAPTGNVTPLQPRGEGGLIVDYVIKIFIFY